MRSVLLVSLIIDGSEHDASRVVDGLLDAGFFQDAINNHDLEDCGPLHVHSASIVSAAPIADHVPREEV